MPDLTDAELDEWQAHIDGYDHEAHCAFDDRLSDLIAEVRRWRELGKAYGERRCKCVRHRGWIEGDKSCPEHGRYLMSFVPEAGDE